MPALLLLALLSLSLSIYGALENPRANYFFSFSRFWELLAGAIAAKSGLAGRLPVQRADALATLGLGLMLASFLLIDETTPTPSTWTLIPVLGTCLFLITARPTSIMGCVLTFGPLRLVGLASYSIYLLHQPILAFARLEGVLTDGQSLRIAGFVILILAAGIASWAWVEQPFRKAVPLARLLGAQCALVVLGLALALTSLPQILVRSEDRALLGTEWREARSYLHRLARSAEARAFTRTDVPRVLIVGDSYGKDFLNALSEAGVLEKIDVSFHQIRSSCGNFAVARDDPALRALSLPAECDDIDRYDSAEVRGRLQEADVVVLGSAWSSWHLPFMQSSLNRIRNLTDARILLLGPKSVGVADLRQLRKLEPSDRVSVRATSDPAVLQVAATLRAQFPDIFVDVQKLLCPGLDGESCPVLDPKGAPISYDGSHLTQAGARLLSKRLVNAGILGVIAATGP